MSERIVSQRERPSTDYTNYVTNTLTTVLTFKQQTLLKITALVLVDLLLFADFQ